jgi:hypothetical protein
LIMLEDVLKFEYNYVTNGKYLIHEKLFHLNVVDFLKFL